MMSASGNASFWSRMEGALAPSDLLRHPYYQAWSAGELTVADLAEYAAEYWHHVAAFPTYLSAFHARLPEGELRREILRNLAEEEGVEYAGGRAHSALWMDFAQGMGAHETAVRSRALTPEVQALIDHFRAAMQGGTVTALATLYAYESRIPAIAASKADGLKRHYKADSATARYFTLHTTADIQHAEVWRKLIDEQVADSGAVEEQALEAASAAGEALWRALDAVEAERQRRSVSPLAAPSSEC